MTYASVARSVIAPPTLTVIADSAIAGERRVVLLVRAAPGTETITMQATDTRVLRAAIDGRAIDTSRYRGGVRPWRLSYTAPPDSGLTLALTVPAGSGVSLDITTRSPGIPSLDGIRLPPRAPDVVTSQTGDVTLSHRSVRIP